MIEVRAAAPGDGDAVTRLGRVALGDRAVGGAQSELGAWVDEHGAVTHVPFGAGRVFVAVEDGRVIGMVYFVPPVQLIQAYAELGEHLQYELGVALCEVELLAVEEPHRRRGVGTALLDAVEDMLREDGCGLVWAKVRAGAFPVMKWLRRRGYIVLAQREPVVVQLRGRAVSFDDGGDGYQLAVRSLSEHPLRRLRRGDGPSYVDVSVDADREVRR